MRAFIDIDQAVLKPEGKAAIDSEVMGKLAQIQKLEVVLVTGHTLRLPSGRASSARPSFC